ncbi:MAG TPA: 30S ribosomal protein S20, partial [Pedococcus sp.]|nr:30S ribosomal protein S20 [Pedococcus sp.]
MANIKSQLKRIKTNRVATERNKAVKSELKTWIRKFQKAAEAGDATAAKDALKTASTKLDKA